MHNKYYFAIRKQAMCNLRIFIFLFCRNHSKFNEIQVKHLIFNI